MQLAEWQEKFAGIGVAIAGMTYDSQDILAGFVGTTSLNYPLLSDTDSQHMNAYGIRNLDYEPDSRFYGIPYPGMVLIDPDGQVIGKFAEPGYRARPETDAVFAAVSSAVGAGR